MDKKDYVYCGECHEHCMLPVDLVDDEEIDGYWYCPTGFIRGIQWVKWNQETEEWCQTKIAPSAYLNP